jgi:hypothetical protein
MELRIRRPAERGSDERERSPLVRAGGTRIAGELSAWIKNKRRGMRRDPSSSVCQLEKFGDVRSKLIWFTIKSLFLSRD